MRAVKFPNLLCLIFLASTLRTAQTLPAITPLQADKFAPPIREQVVKAYEEMRAGPLDASANGRLGMLLHAYEQHEAAAVYFERARALAPREFRWAYYLGLVYSVLGEQQRAAFFFGEAVRQKPDFLPARIRLADSLFALSKLEESRRIYESVLGKDSHSAHAYYGLGRILATERNPAAAVERFLRACDLFKDYGAAHYALALAYRDLGETEKAKQHLSLYQKNKYSRPPLEDGLLDALESLNVSASEHLRKGVELESAGLIEPSITEHERALTADPQLVQAHINLILLYHRLDRPDKAEEHYLAAVKIDPQAAESYYNYGVVLTDEGKYPEAAQAFLQALQINPYYAEANHNYGVMLEREGRLDEAAKYYRAAIDNKPNYQLAHYHLARILVNQRNFTEAIAHLRKTLTPEDENTPLFVYALAAAYVRAGDYNLGLRYLKEAQSRAAAAGQTELSGKIERDLQKLEKHN